MRFRKASRWHGNSRGSRTGLVFYGVFLCKVRIGIARVVSVLS